MTIVMVFRSRLRPDVENAYRPLAAEMSLLAHAMPGFIDEKYFTSSDGERVTVVWFSDFDSHHAWAHHPSHVEAQRRGREEFYSWYDITVAQETYRRSFELPEP